MLEVKKATGRYAGQVVGTFDSPPRYSAMTLACNRVRLRGCTGKFQLKHFYFTVIIILTVTQVIRCLSVIKS